MIITKESDIFQKLLKDVEELKIKLNPYTHYYVGCDPIEEKKQPAKEFKAGDWVVRTVEKPSMGRDFGRVFRIKSTQGSQVYADDHTSHFSSSLRLATYDEIKDHLISQAISRGLVGWRKFRWDKEVGDERITTIVAGHGYEYMSDLDVLTVGVGESEFRRSIYRRGKWATPVFTKETPKTTQELEQVLREFGRCIYASDFLGEMNNEIEKFLRKNNYK